MALASSFSWRTGKNSALDLGCSDENHLWSWCFYFLIPSSISLEMNTSWNQSCGWSACSSYTILLDSHVRDQLFSRAILEIWNIPSKVRLCISRFKIICLLGDLMAGVSRIMSLPAHQHEVQNSWPRFNIDKINQKLICPAHVQTPRTSFL